MIVCEPTKKGDQVKVTFVLPAGEGPVAVVGDFNNWNPGVNHLRVRGDVRTVTLTLSTGRRYAFRYQGPDGQWFNDEHAHRYEPNGYGDDNGIVDLTHGPSPS
jgi:1,4-alpha-glucan branching enzyme